MLKSLHYKYFFVSTIYSLKYEVYLYIKTGDNSSKHLKALINSKEIENKKLQNDISSLRQELRFKESLLMSKTQKLAEPEELSSLHGRRATI